MAKVILSWFIVLLATISAVASTKPGCEGLQCGPTPACPDGAQPVTLPADCCQTCSESTTNSCDGIQCGWPNCPDGAQPITKPGDCCPSCPQPVETPAYSEVVGGQDGVKGQDVEAKADGKDAFDYHPRTYDTAYFYISNNLNEVIHLWGQSDECYNCKFLYLSEVKANTKKLFYMDTRWGLQVSIKDKVDSVTYCQIAYHFGEIGNYTLYVNRNGSYAGGHASQQVECVKPITINKEPHDAFIPIYIAFAVYGGFAILYIIAMHGIRERWFSSILCCFATDHLVNNELGVSTSEPPAPDRNSINKQQQNKPKRLKSLDTFRGISIVIMIFVNYGGGKFWFFAHARWNGLTVADLVFPWFVYIMGVSMALSFRGLVKHEVPRKTILYKIVKRTIILFGLGCVLNSGNSIPYFRVPGVLQRFSISYLVVACLQLYSATPERHTTRVMNKYYAPFRDILDYWYEWLVMAALMLIYSCLTHLLQVPGCPVKGYLGPGGPLVGDNGELANCTGGAASYIDKWILGENHIYQHPTVKLIYKTNMPHDPEGILGSITSILITFLGLQAGKVLLLFQKHGERLKRLIIWGVALGGLGTLLCKASKEDGWIPINKNLWSTSFVLVMAGTAFILLAACYYAIDVKNWWSGAPFYYPGMNSILLYAGHELMKGHFPFSWTPIHKTHTEFLSMDLIGASLWVLIAYWMFFIDFFVKI